MKNCYYHRLPITHFCSHQKCTLPMCNQCLQIHKEQTNDQNGHQFYEHLLTIEQAQELVVNWSRSQLSIYSKAEQSLDYKINILRDTIIHQLDEELSILKNDYLFRANALNVHRNQKNTECLIQAGSIKQLIKAFQRKTKPELQINLQLIKKLKINFNYDKFRVKVSKAFKQSQLGIISHKKQCSEKSFYEGHSVYIGNQNHKNIQIDNLSIESKSQLTKNNYQNKLTPLDSLYINEPISLYEKKMSKKDNWKNVVNIHDVYLNSPRRGNSYK